MGRHGPAFLAYPNFKAYPEWNAAMVYSTTAAYFATRLAGAPPVGPGNGQAEVPTPPAGAGAAAAADRAHYLTGEADGRLGAATRAAVKQAQLKLGLPADSYPSPELTERLRRGGKRGSWLTRLPVVKSAMSQRLSPSRASVKRSRAL